MTTQFGDKYRAWAKITKATMRISHKPGEIMEVDWAGNTLPVYDSVTGETIPIYVLWRYCLAPDLPMRKAVQI